MVDVVEVKDPEVWCSCHCELGMLGGGGGEFSRGIPLLVEKPDFDFGG